MRLHCAVVVLSSNFLRACNQHGVKRHFHEAGSLPIEFSIKLVVCHHRGGAAARRVLGRTAPGAASGRSSPACRPARLRTACGGAGGPAARRAAPGRAGQRRRRGGAAARRALGRAGPGAAFGRSSPARPPAASGRRAAALGGRQRAGPRRAAAAARRRGGAAAHWAGPGRAQHPGAAARPAGRPASGRRAAALGGTFGCQAVLRTRTSVERRP
jgi:hypothetical protein